MQSFLFLSDVYFIYILYNRNKDKGETLLLLLLLLLT
jgi:hypothetical protein